MRRSRSRRRGSFGPKGPAFRGVSAGVSAVAVPPQRPGRLIADAHAAIAKLRGAT